MRREFLRRINLSAPPASRLPLLYLSWRRRGRQRLKSCLERVEIASVGAKLRQLRGRDLVDQRLHRVDAFLLERVGQEPRFHCAWAALTLVEKLLKHRHHPCGAYAGPDGVFDAFDISCCFVLPTEARKHSAACDVDCGAGSLTAAYAGKHARQRHSDVGALLLLHLLHRMATHDVADFVTKHASQLVHLIGALDQATIHVHEATRNGESVDFLRINDEEMPIQVAAAGESGDGSAEQLVTLARDLSRRKAREKHSMFVAEGVRCVEELLRSGLRIRGVLVAPQLTDAPRGAELRRQIQEAGVELTEVNEKDFRSAAETESPQGVLAVADVPLRNLDTLQVGAECRLLLLDGVQDPGNVGTILRTAAALRASATIALPGTVDLWNPKVIRSSMGAQFHHPALHAGVEETLQFLERNAVDLWATDSERR